MNELTGICAGVDLDESKLMLVFSVGTSDGQLVKYACTCESFASGAGIDAVKLNVDDWRKFCHALKGKKLTFKIEEGIHE